MKTTIAVASGKGGTGKTTISIALAKSLVSAGHTVKFNDADVEEPNASLFLDVDVKQHKTVMVEMPVVDEELCDGCGVCREVCEFNAITILGGKPLVFEELCHSCNSCVTFCPQKAIGAKEKEIGNILSDRENSEKMDFSMGVLNIGEIKSTEVIGELKSIEHSLKWEIIDAPPGTTCPVISATKNVDYLILVTEPTPFGLNDLKLAVLMADKMKLNYGVVINRSDLGDDEVKKFCKSKNVDVLLEIPFRKKVAEKYAIGQSLLDTMPELGAEFVKIAEKIRLQ